MEGLQKLSAKSIDVVVTSPPYNRKIRYRTYRDDLPRDEYWSWMSEWIRETKRVMAESASFFLNVSGSSRDPLLAHEVALLASHCGFRLQNTIHWIKSISLENPDGTVLSRGHFQPVNSNRHLNACHEYVFHLTKTGRVSLYRKAIGVPYADKSNVARWAHTGATDVRCRGNAWFVPYPTVRGVAGERPHPATFPVDLAEKCLRLHGAVGRMVLDPFAGIGSSAVAAWRAGAGGFLGFEIDPEYATQARHRLAAELVRNP